MLAVSIPGGAGSTNLAVENIAFGFATAETKPVGNADAAGPSRSTDDISSHGDDSD